MIEADFPDAYATARATLADLVRSNASEERGFRVMADTMAAVRRGYSHHAALAPDPALKQVIADQVAIFEAMASNPLTCNEIMFRGVAAVDLAQAMSMDLDHIRTAAISIFRAMAAGRDNPVSRRRPTDADRDRLQAHAYANGMTDADFDLIADPRLDDPRLCGAVIDLYRNANSATFKGADRVRAEMVTGFLSH